MNDQSNQFTVYIPSEISSDSNLNLSEMKVLSIIKALDNKNSCYANNSYLAECTSLSERQVSRVISSLVKKEYIEIENGKSFRRKIKMKNRVVADAPTNEDVPSPSSEDIPPPTPKKKTNVVPIKKGCDKENKINKFNSMYSHEWNIDLLEELAELQQSAKLGYISQEQYNDMAAPLMEKLYGRGENSGT